MLLFSKSENKDKREDSVFYVFSRSPLLNENLTSELRLAGLPHVRGIKCTIPDELQGTIPDDISGAVIDIGDCTDVDTIVQQLQMLIPGGVWYCVVGNSDSITLAQQFSSYNVAYYHSSAQRDLLVEAAVNGSQAVTKKKAIMIGILGCKGGVGNSRLAWHIARKIADEKRVATLLVSGSGGTRDMDIISGKKLSHEYTSVKKHLDIYGEPVAQLSEVAEDAFHRYNFVIYEQSIHTASKEQLRGFAEQALCLVLVIDRSFSSARVARAMLEQVEVLHRINRLSRRVYLCFNDNRPGQHSGITLEDLEKLLEQRVDIHIPYIKSGLERVSALPSDGLLTSHGANSLDLLVDRILGVARTEKKLSVLNTIFRRIRA
jgi:pilus assembly protein CpaE